MGQINNVVELRRAIFRKVAEAILNKEFDKRRTEIANELNPDGAETDRKDIPTARIITNAQISAMIGEDMPEDVMMRVVPEACAACGKASYRVSEYCRACVAHPCSYACKKDALKKVPGEKAHIDQDKCIRCGLCAAACPYGAIVYQPVPCEAACPVGAISKDESGKEHIDAEKCIYCGKCMVACPFGAIWEKSFIRPIFTDIQQGKTVIAMVAPSLGGQFKQPYGKVLSAIKALGFSDVIEVAKGANVTTENDKNEFLERIGRGDKFITTSCCASWLELIRKHIPNIKPFVSDALTPLGYTAQMLKEKDPNAVLVFVAPCVAKRSEMYRNPNVDYVLSYEELDCLFSAAKINIAEQEAMPLDPTILEHGRGFAYIAGVTDSVKAEVENPEVIRGMVIDGLTKNSVRDLKEMAKDGVAPNGCNFVEVMACIGGCVGGCDTLAMPKAATRQIMSQAKGK